VLGSSIGRYGNYFSKSKLVLSAAPRDFDATYLLKKGEIPARGLLAECIFNNAVSIAIVQFDNNGWPAGTRSELFTSETFPERTDIGSSKVAISTSAYGESNDLLGLAWCYAMEKFSEEGFVESYKAYAAFATINRNGKLVGKIRTLSLPGNGANYLTKVFKPIYSGEKWLLPLVARKIDNNKATKNVLYLYAISDAGITRRIVDSSNKTYADIRISAFDGVSFLENTGGSSGKTAALFYQSKNFGTKLSPDKRLFDSKYKIRRVSTSGKLLANPNVLKIDQWIPDLIPEKNTTNRIHHAEIPSQPRATNSGQYIFTVTYQARTLGDNWRYSIPELDFQTSLFRFSLESPDVETIKSDLFPDGYNQDYYEPDKIRADMAKVYPSGTFAVVSNDFSFSLPPRGWRGYGELLFIEEQGKRSNPEPRADHTLSYDQKAKHVLLFGGADGGKHYKDLWANTSDGWHLLDSGKGPSARARHAMAWDSKSRRTLIYGGRNNSGAVFKDTWAWNGKNWKKLSAKGPKAIYGHSMVQGKGPNRIYLFGGRNKNNFSNSLHYWNGKSWVRIKAEGDIPVGRSEAAVCWSNKMGGLLVHGGFDGKLHRGDLYLWTPGAGWKLLEDDFRWQTNSSRPYPSFVSGAVLAELPIQDNKIIIISGFNKKDGVIDASDRVMQLQFSSGAYEWRGDNIHGSPSPHGRAGHATAWDSKRKKLILFGGWDGSVTLSDTWQYTGQVWQFLQP
jgi:hypothetical protein